MRMKQVLEGFGDQTFRNQERNAGLEHETNNIAISINGKVWKVVPGKGYADSREEQNYLNGMKNWAETKSAATGKKWSVSLTGAPLSEMEKKGVAEALAAKIAELTEMISSIKESATAGATSSGNIATIANPHLSPGKARGMKSFTGSPGKSGTKAPPQPKPKSNTGVNGLDVKSVSIFGGPKAR